MRGRIDFQEVGYAYESADSHSVRDFP